MQPVRLPPQSPNLNAHLERLFESVKSDCLRKQILFGETAACRTARASLLHYHTARNPQGRINELIVPMNHPPNMDAEIETTEHLGGLLRSYRWAAKLGGFLSRFRRRFRTDRMGDCFANQSFWRDFSPPPFKLALISPQNQVSSEDVSLRSIGQSARSTLLTPLASGMKPRQANFGVPRIRYISHYFVRSLEPTPSLAVDLQRGIDRSNRSEHLHRVAREV